MGGITTQLFRGFLLLSIFLSTSFFLDLNAQCAGEDGTLDHCDKETNRYIDLFSALAGTPQADGTWSDDNNSGGLNTTTGELDTYFINIGGTFSYTYTVDGVSGCTDNQATVTVTLGSFPGRDNANGVACSDDSSVNLFQFTGSSPSPTLDGTWDSSNAPAGSLNGNIFNASSAGEGIYEFVYTVPVQGNCSSSSSIVNLEVIRAPESGSYVQPVFCETDDLSAFTNFDLREVLTDEDSGGTWTENSITDEISGPTDSVINVENIRDTFGPGIYTYTYRVNPINPACSPSQISVAILIEDVVDFTDAVFEVINPSNDPAFICEDQLPFQATAQITVDPLNVPNGDYQITYETRPAPNAGSETLRVTFNNGIASFDIDETFLTQAGEVTVEITEVIDPSTQLECQIQISGLSDTLSILPLPDLSDSILQVEEPICLNENATVNLSDATSTANIELIDGTYDFTYIISGPSGTVTDTETLTSTAGTVSWTLSSLNIDEAGDYTLTIIEVVNESGCAATTDLSDTFVVTPLPDAQNIVLDVQDNCEGSPITVLVSEPGSTPQITDGIYTLEYALNGAINESGLTATAVSFTNGNASFNLSDDILLSGSSTITLIGLINETTGCESV
ncbi:hypothetical protein, partial [uncultured Salegentibacter sp.]|uniref:hypothetical protein n=1 Tax=uncultured Salegentibacter sp. TaxID=259320 RepID=UPI0030DA8F63